MGIEMPKLPPLILLVEDEADLRELITDIAGEAGLRMEVASTYPDGVALLNASQPTLLIANVMLPGGDGHKLAEVARRFDVPTLLISGHPEVIWEDKARGVAFLAKPFRVDELQRVIRSFIEDPTRLPDSHDSSPPGGRGNTWQPRHHATVEAGLANSSQAL